MAWLAFAVVATAETRVFAAASLKTALDEVTAAYTDRSGEAISLTYAGSSVLARQIALGAPADIFLSANTLWMDHVDDAGRVAQRVDLLSNRLVLISTPDAAPVSLTPGTSLIEALAQDRLAMALVQAVPAGIYGQQALETLGLWDQLSPRVAQTDNVRAALRLVATGAASYGIVYHTDARADPSVKVMADIPPDSHDPILYPAALLGDATPEASAFWTWLTGPEAQTNFLDHGFLPAPAP